VRAPLLLTIAAIAASATRGAEAPEEIAHRYIQGMADLKIEAVADAMHPSALDRFKTILIGIADGIKQAPADRKAPAKMVSALFGDEGPAAVRTFPPRDVFVRFMSNLTTFVPQIREMHAGSEYQLLGHVNEGGNVAHVVFRATLRRGENELTKMEVLSLKRDGQHWRVLLTDDLQSLIAGLGQRMTAPPTTPERTASGAKNSGAERPAATANP
jgi:hypothetical protein